MSKTSNFIDKIGAMATVDMRNTGVLASLTISQAILESAWGESGLASNANNLFGIKATTAWTGKVYSADTKECYDGTNLVTVNAEFKAYDSWDESLADHSALITGASRYAKVVGETDYKTACQAIKDAGYATDPDYPSKLITLIEQYKLYEFDVVEEGVKEHWAKPFENALLEKGIISAEKNLDSSPTCGEIAVMLCNVLGLEVKP